jgi:16S rRNA (guanine1516-N2)-methyltransferase
MTVASHLAALGLDATVILKRLPDHMTLSLVDGVLSLTDSHMPAARVAVDFVSGGLAYRAGGHVGGEHLVKACQIKSLAHTHVLDATCGMGKDSFLLASSGLQVTACEQHPVVHALLTDGLARLEQSGGDSGFALLQQNAELVMQQQHFDVIYLDPMFPEKSKAAKTKKDMQLFQRLHGHQTDEAAELLTLALQTDCRRVVIKRPPKAPLLLNRKPTFQIGGKSCRFDAFQLR